MRASRGFTLIELLVVIAIIALLASVVLASAGSLREYSRDAKRIADLDQFEKALELYYHENDSYPNTGWRYSTDWGSTLTSALAPYLSEMPVDPVNNAIQPWSVSSDNHTYAYTAQQDGQSFELVARLETDDHPQSCGNMDYKRTRVGQIGDPWCEAFGGAYSDQMYSIVP